MYLFYNKKQLHSVKLFLYRTMCGILTRKDSKRFKSEARLSSDEPFVAVTKGCEGTRKDSL